MAMGSPLNLLAPTGDPAHHTGPSVMVPTAVLADLLVVSMASVVKM